MSGRRTGATWDTGILTMRPQTRTALIALGSVGLVGLVGAFAPAAALPAQNRGAPDSTRAAARRDYAAPLGAPYTAEDVTVPTPMGHTLAGTLTLPRGASRA